MIFVGTRVGRPNFCIYGCESQNCIPHFNCRDAGRAACWGDLSALLCSTSPLSTPCKGSEKMPTQIVADSLNFGLSVGRSVLAFAKTRSRGWSKHAPDVLVVAVEKAEEFCVSFVDSKAGRLALGLAARAISAADNSIAAADTFLLEHRYTAAYYPALREIVVAKYVQWLAPIILNILQLLDPCTKVFASESEAREQDACTR